MRLDAHQHFWTLSRGDYGWLTADLSALYRDFGPADLVPLLDRHAIGGTILVQAAPTDAETDFMLSLAAQHGFIKGVVGWADFAAPDAPARIVALSRNPKLLGLRPMIQDLPDDDWITRDGLDAAFDALIARDLTFDALVLPRHLGPLLTRMRRHPALRVVIDHGAKPPLAHGPLDGWARDMATLARETGAYCKLSGLVTEAGRGWTVDTLRRCTDHLLDIFGPDRLIWGSDWPVCTLAASYADWYAATDRLLADLTEAQRTPITGLTAARATRLPQPA